MPNFRSHINAFFQAVPDTVRAHRLKVWVLFVLMAIVIAPGLSKFQIDLSDDFFFPEDAPVRIAYDQFRGQFGSDESIYLVYRAKDGDVFSYESLKAVYDLQEELLNYRLQLQPGETSPLDRITEITSLVNVSYLEASENALVSRRFIGDKLPRTAAERETYRQAALAHPDYPYMYVSPDGEYGGIILRTSFKARIIGESEIAQVIDDEAGFEFDVAEMSFDESGSQEDVKQEFEAVDWSEYATVMHAVDRIINQPQYTSALEYHPVGIPPLNAFIWDNFIPQINVLMIAAILLVVISLGLLFRSFFAVLWPMLIVAASSVFAIALMGWLGLKMNLMVNITVLLVLVVGVADSVHILSGYLFFRNKGMNHVEALNATYEKSGLAVFLTSITTAIGMLALTVVDVQPIENFGISAAIGVMFAFLLSVFLLPLMLDIGHPVSKKRTKVIAEKGRNPHLIQRFLIWAEPLSYRHPRINVAIFVAVTLVFGFGISKIEVDSNPISIFAEGNPIRDAYNLVDDVMAGTTSLEIMLDAGEEYAFHDPQLLNAMDELQSFLESKLAHTVTVTRSLVDIVKDSHQALNGGNEQFYSIPQEEQLLSQTLFLFNNANAEDRRKVVSDDYRHAHITVNMVNQGSRTYISTMDEITSEVDRVLLPLKAQYPDLEITLTGTMTLFTTLLDFLSWSQIKGFGLALVIISLILLFIFQSAKIGIVALFPNVFPLILVFGTMGYAGIALDVDTLTIAPLMIGIIVDDTIHFLTHFRAEVLKHGDIKKAIIKAFQEVGQAITFTSIILAIAFLAFTTLDHQGLANFGLLSAMAIISALLAELFLLPALLILTKAGTGSRSPQAMLEGASRS